MPLRRLQLASLLLALSTISIGIHPLLAQSPAVGVRVPAGFQVTEFAGSDLANDIYCMTIDPAGRVIVSGRGYIRILVDTDGDGRADRADEFSKEPRDGAMGMLWEGDALFVTGDGGLRRLRDRDGNNKADGPAELIRRLTTGGEHSAHAIRRGPDGWLYVLGGNHSGVDSSFAQMPTSPVKTPTAGCVIRFTPDLKQSEIVAHGFRNPYGMDFGLDGELFAFDSDNERCVSLPWYEFTRFYHVIPGGHHGWLSPQRAQFWRMPPAFLDVTPPVAHVGRGSPTGVVCYRHTQFPENYHGGFFLCDWTFGKVHFAKLIPHGSTYTAQPTVFLEAAGDNGFAPTACAVHPRTGDLFVSIGGRGTRGAVYRVRHANGFPPGDSTVKTPQSTLDWNPSLTTAIPDNILGKQPLQQLRGLLLLERFQKRFTPAQTRKLITARIQDRDRPIRQVLARLVRRLPENERDTLLSQKDLTPPACITLALAVAESQPARALSLLRQDQADFTPADWLDVTRVYQILLGDIVAASSQGTIWEGYTRWHEPGDHLKQILAREMRPVLSKEFKDGSDDLLREQSRLWALGAGLADWPSEKLARRTADRLMKSGPVEDIHNLAVISRLLSQPPKGVALPATQQARVVDTLVTIDRRIEALNLNRDRHWPLRFVEMYRQLARSLPELNGDILQHKEFGRPDHVIFARTPGFDRKQAARVFIKRSQSPEFAWTPELVRLLGDLPAGETDPLLRKLWDNASLETALLPLLARRPRAEDRDKYVAGLVSPQLDIVQTALDALDNLPAKKDPEEVAALLRALGNLPDQQAKMKERVADRLARITGQNFKQDRSRWLAWIGRTYPNLSSRLTNPDGVDLAMWSKRLAAMDWQAGEVGRGKEIFKKASCINCHSGRAALGPDLAGVTGRFSRDDLLTAILQPSRDVPLRYQAKLIETESGKVYQGVIIYDAVDGLILQTGATETIRIAGDNIAARRPAALSLMPAGLLDRLSNAEIADLYAYLRSLGKVEMKRK